MRVTIVVNDNIILVDGVARQVACAKLATEGKHALQWYGEWGEIEFATKIDNEKKCLTREPNKTITDLAEFQPYIEQWGRAEPLEATPRIEPDGI